MDNGTNVFVDAKHPGADIPFAAHVPDDWRLARAVRANLLLTNASRMQPAVPEVLLVELRGPVFSWCPRQVLVLPPVDRVRTLLLHEVGALALDDQQRLVEWLDRAIGYTQVVSTTSESLLRRVDAGTFLERLYYRLNTVCLDVNDWNTDPRRC